MDFKNFAWVTQINQSEIIIIKNTLTSKENYRIMKQPFDLVMKFCQAIKFFVLYFLF